MKKLRFTTLLFTLVASMAVVQTNAQSQTTSKQIMVKLTEPVDINTAKTAKARFAELTPEGLKKGLDKTVLFGVLQKSPGVGKYTVDITWNGVMSAGSKSPTPFEPVMTSKLITKSTILTTDKAFSATGDLEAMSLAAQKITGNSNLPQNSTTEAKEKEEDKNNKRNTGSNSSSGSGGISGGQSGGGNTESVPSLEGGGNSVTYEACPSRVDYEGGMTYNLEREITKDSTGKIISRGDCVETGNFARFKSTEIVACQDRVDQESGLIYTRQKEVQLDENGEAINEGVCADTGETRQFKNAEIIACGEEFDISKGLIFEMVKINALDVNGTVISESECEVSDQSYTPRIEYIDCPITLDGETAVFHHRPQYFNTSNQSMYTGDCIETGQRVQATRDYNAGCSDSINLDSKLAYRRYDLTVQVDGETQILRTCASDLSDGLPLISTYTGCTVRDDFIGGFSIQQERFYYLLNGNEVQATQCFDSDVTYAHYETIDGCTANVDTVNNRYTEFSQIAYNIGGQVFYPSSCKPVSGGSQDLSLEICPGEFNHDFSAGQSTQLERYYYVDSNGNKTYATTCSPGSTTYEHTETATLCEMRHDDDGRKSYPSSRTMIQVGGADIEIRECGERQATIPYISIGTRYESVSRSANRTLTCGANTVCSCPGSGKTWYDGGGSIKSLPGFSCSYQPLLEKYLTRAWKHTVDQYTDWQRGDGSTYSQYITRHTNVAGK